MPSRGESSIDISRYLSLGLVHVQYDSEDPLAKILALITLSPIFLLCAYITIILYRRELTFINALFGQLSCEAFNLFLKRLIRQPRPFPGQLGKGYGMPSSHSQFVGFFAAFFLSHFALHHPVKATPRTLINTIRRAEHVLVMVGIVVLASATAYSRYHLSYHTPAQIWTGLVIGLIFGGSYYYATEYIPRLPLRLPAPLGSPQVSRSEASFSIGQANGDAKRSPNGLRHRAARRPEQGVTTSRRSSLTAMVTPELHPAPPIRQLILDHPLAVAFRVRDSWTVWRDGGIEGEYGTWRREWERRREWSYDGARQAYQQDGSEVENGSTIALKQPDAQVLARRNGVPAKAKEEEEEETHFQVMLRALRLANLCEPTQTAFCVGCVIRIPGSSAWQEGSVLAEGYSRKLPGNTHAEQCALDKIALAKVEGQEEEEAEEELTLDLYTTMEPCSERLSGALPCVDRILAFNRAADAEGEGGAVYDLSKLSSASSSGSAKTRSQKQQQQSPRRLVKLRIGRVFQGVQEPEDFVQCVGTRRLREAGVEVYTVKARVPLLLPSSSLPSANKSKRSKEGGQEEEKEDWDWLEKECLRVAKWGHADQPVALPGAREIWEV